MNLLTDLSGNPYESKLDMGLENDNLKRIQMVQTDKEHKAQQRKYYQKNYE